MKYRIGFHALPVANLGRRRDPARITTLVRGHISKVRRQFAELRSRIVHAFTVGEFSDPIATEDVANVFCATGPGGGVDATCSPGGLGPMPQLMGKEDEPTGPSKFAAAAHLAKDVVAQVTGLAPTWLKSTGAMVAKASMAGVIAGNAAVRAVAKERGLSDAQITKLSATVACVDVAMGGWRGAGVASALGLGALAVPAAVVPLGSLGYLAYSTVRNPAAVFRAAKNAVTGAIGLAADVAMAGAMRLTGNSRAVPSYVEPVTNELDHPTSRAVAEAVADHDCDDWYFALLMAAIDVHHDAHKAIATANKVYGPIDNSNPEGCNQYTGPCGTGDLSKLEEGMAKIKAEAIAYRIGPHGGDWQEIEHHFPGLQTPVFHTTRSAIQAMDEGLESGKGSVFGGPKGGGNINSISMSSNLDWTTKGQGAAFGRTILVMDENSLEKHGTIRDHQAPTISDYEFERRFEGSKIPPSEIKGMVFTQHLGRSDIEEKSEWPFPVVYKDRAKGWTLIPHKITNERSGGEYFARCARDEKGHCTAEGVEVVAPKELKAARAKAIEKAAAAAKPTPEQIAAAHAKMNEIGADDYEMGIRGNSKDRAKSRAKILKEFGNGDTCPCVYCGIKLDDGTVTRDKVYTAREGGRYKHDNLVPACLGCNQSRGDVPWNKIKWK